MNNSAKHQKGDSLIAKLIVLAILGFGVYVLIQYVPQFVEARSIQSILDNMQTTQRTDPVTTESEAKERVIKMLQVNEMNDMVKVVRTSRKSNGVEVKFSYERDLNLIYKIKPIQYELSVRLN